MHPSTCCVDLRRQRLAAALVIAALAAPALAVAAAPPARRSPVRPPAASVPAKYAVPAPPAAAARARVTQPPYASSAYRQIVEPKPVAARPAAPRRRVAEATIRKAAGEGTIELDDVIPIADIPEEAGDAIDDLPEVSEPDLELPPGTGSAPAAPAAPEEQTPEPMEEEAPRRFKRINEINPFYDYEPDPALIAKDKCFNLCPRPSGPDCPDCEVADPVNPPNGRNVCPDCPAEKRLQDLGTDGQSVVYQPRNFPHIHYCWEPTNLYHYPLYFEDFCLERYGHSRCYLIQPIFSGALMAAQFVGLPYQMSIDPICKRRYTLGWYRPGACVPPMYYQVPWNTEAALTEAAVITGAYYLWAPGVTP